MTATHIRLTRDSLESLIPAGEPVVVAYEGDILPVIRDLDPQRHFPNGGWVVTWHDATERAVAAELAEPVTAAEAEAWHAMRAVDSIVGEVMAQLEELSDDTIERLPFHDDPTWERLHAIAEDLRETLIVTVRQRVSDWVCDADLPEGVYDSEWHRAISR